MKNNTYFKAMRQTDIEYGKARKVREEEKKAILERSDWDALDAWHEREAGFKYPFTAGQEKAYSCHSDERHCLQSQSLLGFL